ncbi:MAG: DUF1465 family protein [Holosporales bacterium]|jgi:regulator of CtrA degradation
MLQTAVQSTRTAVAGNVVEKMYDEAYTLLLESRSYLMYVAPGLKQNMEPQDKLFVTYHATRLTARLLEIISWLLAQKAVLRGEMTLAESRQGGFTISQDSVCAFDASEECGSIPNGLRGLLSRSKSLYERLGRLDGMLEGKVL